MKIMKCPSCNKEIPDNSKFCPECGAKITSVENSAEMIPVEVPSVNNDTEENKPIKKHSKKKIIIYSILALVIIVIISFFIKQNNQYDFRKAKWGMTKNQVKASETLDLEGEYNNTLIYSPTNFGTYKVTPCYSFDKHGNLESAICFYLENQNFATAKFKDAKAYYNDFVNIATKYYGKPKNSTTSENPSCSNYDSTVWETSNSKITIEISDLMNGNDLSITYEKK